MAKAYIGTVECQVRVDRDLGDTWAVTVVPLGKIDRSTPRLVVKLLGEDRDKVTVGALEILQKAGQIDRFDP